MFQKEYVGKIKTLIQLILEHFSGKVKVLLLASPNGTIHLIESIDTLEAQVLSKNLSSLIPKFTSLVVKKKYLRRRFQPYNSPGAFSINFEVDEKTLMPYNLLEESK